MAKAPVKKVKYKQETYQPVVKKGDGKLTEEGATRLRSDRMKGYSVTKAKKNNFKAKVTNTI